MQGGGGRLRGGVAGARVPALNTLPPMKPLPLSVPVLPTKTLPPRLPLTARVLLLTTVALLKLLAPVRLSEPPPCRISMPLAVIDEPKVLAEAVFRVRMPWSIAVRGP